MKNQVTADGMIAFDDHGERRPVVLLHAFPLARVMWRPQVEALQDLYRVITPDLRGFGDTGAFAGPPSVEQMADDVATLLTELAITEPVVLGGLSMGGYVALAFARRHADRLRALVLADTRSEADGPEARANRDQLIRFAAGHTARDVIDQMLPKMVSQETSGHRPEVVEEVRRIASAQSPDGIIGALQALRDRPDATSSLGAITVPTLVVVGRDDVLSPPETATALASRIRGARLVVIDGAGHLSNLEQPGRFNDAIRAFLQSLAH
jgi:pimeloyl-ACP methyl ester carboxylesterase